MALAGRRWRSACGASALVMIATGVAVPASAGASGDWAPGVPSSVHVDDVEVPVLATFTGRVTGVSRYDLVGGAVHGVQRVDGATVLYASVGYADGADERTFFSDILFGIRATGYPNRALPSMALVDREGLKSYRPLKADRETLFTTRSTDVRISAGELGVVWAVFPELPASVTHVDVVLGDTKIPIGRVEVGQGALEPVAEEAVPRPGTGWPRLPDVEEISRADPAASTFDLLRRTESLDGELATTESAQAVSATLDANVLFDKVSAELTPAAQDVLRQVAADIAARGTGEVIVTGHTDSDGSRGSNQVLSEQRAASVVAAMQPEAGSNVTFVAAGMGESDPVAPNDTPENKQLNRRVTVEYQIRGGGA